MNGEMSPDDVVMRLSRAIDAAPGLPRRDIDSIKQHMRAGELLLAFENLSTQLYEYEIPLEDPFVTSLTQVGVALGADQRYLSLLDQENY